MLNILLIEDDIVDQKSFKRLVAKQNLPYSYQIASSVAEALDAISRNKYDLVITDYYLGDGTSFEIIPLLRGVPTIITTGTGDEEIAVKAMKLGAYDYLIKDVDRNYLKVLPLTVDKAIQQQRSRERLLLLESALSNKTANSVFIANTAGKIQWVNEGFVEKTGYNREQIIESMGEMFSADGETQLFDPSVREKLIRNKKAFSSEVLNKTSNGSEYWALVHFTPVISDTGEVERLMAIATDITRKKQAEEKLVKSEQQHRLLFNNNPMTMLIYDVETLKVLAVNDAMLEKYKYSREEFQTMTLEDLHPKDSLKELYIDIDNVRQGNSDGVQSWKHVTRDGVVFDVEVTAKSIDYSGQVARLVLINDVTERRKWETEIIAARDAAEAARKSKEQFLANMSHEIRTPMNGIIGMSNLLMKTEMNEKQSGYLSAIKESADNLLVIINDILDFSKIEAGKVTFESTDFSVRKLVDTLQKTLTFKLEDKGIYLNVNLDDDLPDKIVGDPVRLNQIILNLVSNAIKFTEEGGLTLNVDVKRELKDEIELLIEVQDTGIGIPKDKLDDIFSSFTQASSDTTRKYGGTGLGLTITKQLVELQGGEIGVKSTAGEGSTFYFTIRYGRWEAENDAANGADILELPTLEELGRLKVLLVEDNQINQLLATQILFDWNFNVDVAFNGIQAIEKAEQNDYDLILMDINMPEMDGFSATKHIRTKLNNPMSQVPIMAMTASALKGDNEKCFDVGMNDYISKPFDPDNLYAKIAGLIYKRSA